MVNKDQRVAVFVDVQNMYYSAKQLYNSKVNFGKLLEDAVNGRKLVRAMAYAISADVGKEEKFQEALIKIGYEVRLKNLQIFQGGAKKGDWDIGIAMDIVRIAPKVDVIVLVSGDGDFQDLMEYVRAQGCRAEVMAFHKTSSSRIREAADSFNNLEDDKYLIKYRQHNKRTPAEVNKIKAELQKKNLKVTENEVVLKGLNNGKNPVKKKPVHNHQKTVTKPTSKPAVKTEVKKVENKPVVKETVQAAPPVMKGAHAKEEPVKPPVKKVVKKVTKKVVKKATKKVTEKKTETKKPKLFDKIKKVVTKK